MRRRDRGARQGGFGAPGRVSPVGVPGQRRPSAADVVVPRQLPAYTAHFVGRSAELAALTSLLDRAACGPAGGGGAGPVVISAGGGVWGGVGGGARGREVGGLVAAGGARPRPLGLLPGAEAGELLARHLGPDRAAAEPQAIDELTGLCAGLPLALSAVAARAAARPGFPLAVLAAELRDVRGRLDALDAGDPATSMRAVLSWSCRHLDPPAAALFRPLGIHPRPDISP